MKVTIIRFIGTHSIRVRTGMDWLTPRQVSRRDHDVVTKLCHGSRMRPCLPNLLQAAHQIRRELPFAVRRSIQDEVAVSEIQWPKPLVNDGLHRLERSIRVSLLPEPSPGKGHTGQGRHVATFWHLLPGILLKSLHVGIVEPARRILTSVEIADQAVRLEILDVLINLVERHLLIRDATPGCIPAISDEDINLPIACEQLRQLILDELNLARRHIEMADIIAQ